VAGRRQAGRQVVGSRQAVARWQAVGGWQAARWQAGGR
jgi:hypothetical protein